MVAEQRLPPRPVSALRVCGTPPRLRSNDEASATQQHAPYRETCLTSRCPPQPKHPRLWILPRRRNPRRKRPIAELVATSPAAPNSGCGGSCPTAAVGVHHWDPGINGGPAPRRRGKQQRYEGEWRRTSLPQTVTHQELRVRCRPSQRRQAVDSTRQRVV